MSICPLVKVTLYGAFEDKERILSDLQAHGCLHLIPLAAKKPVSIKEGPSTKSRNTLKFLFDCPQKRKPLMEASDFDPNQIESEVLSVKHQLQEMQLKRDFLQKRISDLEPWGNFHYSPLQKVKDLRLWFYTVPHYKMNPIYSISQPWQVVQKDNRFSYVIVISPVEPREMPVPRTHTGDIPPSELKRQYDEVETILEDLHLKRVHLTRWRYLFSQSLNRLEDQAALSQASRDALDDPPVFAVQGWVPEMSLLNLQAYVRQKELAIEIEKPKANETPPTLMKNPPPLDGGQDLVSFYMTPSYWTWDPSQPVFLSFVIFFSLVLSDAGYAVLLGLGLVFSWKYMSKTDFRCRLRTLFAALVTASVVWGMLIGSYFGANPPPDSLLAPLKLFDIHDSTTMMRLSIFLGAFHVAWAHLATIQNRCWSIRSLVSIGWVVMILGALMIWLSFPDAAQYLLHTGYATLGLGAFLVLWFTHPQSSTGFRLLKGALALTRITNAFGDVLSYLRLFALGLASASLAFAFNDLAAQVAQEFSGMGKLLALMVLLIGHGFNLVLAVVSGFIHGLRLNFIEFFNWGIEEEGMPFRPFMKKEKLSWNH